jgi:hypothetical protein
MQGYARFLLSLGLGIVHAFVAFFVPFLGMAPLVDTGGYAMSNEDFGITVFCSVVAIVTFRIAAQCSYWTVLHHIFFWGSIVLYPIVVVVVSAMPVSMGLYKTGYLIFRQSSFYFSLLGAVVLAMSPVVSIANWERSQATEVNRIMYSERHGWLEQKVSLLEARVRPIPGEAFPQPDVPVYPDRLNPTGTVFDQPETPVVARLRSQVTRDGEKFRSIYAFVDQMRPKPSTFDPRVIDDVPL